MLFLAVLGVYFLVGLILEHRLEHSLKEWYRVFWKADSPPGQEGYLPEARPLRRAVNVYWIVGFVLLFGFALFY